MERPLERAAKLCGGMAALAEAIGETIQTVSNWRVRGVPDTKAPAVELASGGAVLVEELCQSVRWVRVADPQWPHTDGRPCIDVAREVA